VEDQRERQTNVSLSNHPDDQLALRDQFVPAAHGPPIQDPATLPCGPAADGARRFHEARAIDYRAFLITKISGRGSRGDFLAMDCAPLKTAAVSRLGAT